MNKSLISAMALGMLAVPAWSQSGVALNADKEEDAYAVAEQLYNQCRTSSDASDRAAGMRRAAELFGDFARRFPNSRKRQRAMCFEALCLTEAGDLSAADNRLSVLANNFRGEYAASAAYKLATRAYEREVWDEALDYYFIAVRETRRPELRYDALFRSGNVLLKLGRRMEAEDTFRSFQVMKDVKPALAQSALFAIAQMKVEDGDDATAYQYFRNILSTPNLEQEIAGPATLQAARLAARMGHSEDSRKLYARLATMPGMEEYAVEARMAREESSRATGEIIINACESADGELVITVDRERFSREALATLLRRYVKLNQNVPVRICGDADMHWQKMEAVISTCKQAGVWNVSFSTKMPEDKSAK